MKTAEDWLKENCHENDWDKLHDCLNDSLWATNTVAYMEAYAEQFNPKWISVENGLPDPTLWEDRYQNLHLVYCDRGHYGYEGFAYYGECLGDDLRWHVLAEEHRIMQSNLGSVTHWMPFPERP